MASNFRTEIQAFVAENLSPDARSKALADLAISERDKLIKSGQASRFYVTSVDGIKGASENAVKGTGGGVINYHFSFLADAVEYALAYLRRRVPRLTGKLSESWWVSVNGAYIPPGLTISYGHIPGNSEVIIGNTQAYWRKAETNRVGNRALNYRQPNELDDCAQSVKREFGASAISVVRLYDYQFPGKYVPKKSTRFNSPVLVLKAID